MSCEEAYEWMQRDLDGDLSDDEQTMLKQHLTLCRDCASLYQRLSSLSTHLAQLPLVEPPISIVNSILPELDRIDRERAVTPPIQEQAAAFEGTRQRTKRAIWYRYIGGATAAGLLLSAIVFALNDDGQPLKQSAFSSPQVKVGNTAQEHTKAFAEANEQKKIQQQTGDQQATVPSDPQPPAPGEAAPEAGVSSNQGTESNEAAPDTKKPYGEAKRSVAQVPAEQQQERASVPEQKNTGEQSASPAPDSGKGEQPPAPDNPAPAENGGVSIAQAPNASDSSQRAGIMAEPEPSKDNERPNANNAVALAKEQSKDGKKTGRPAIASTAQSSTYKPPGKPSPEEQYFVSKVDNRLLVRDANGSIAFITRPWNDMYNVSYRWIDAKRIVYNLEYVGGSGQADPVPLQSQEWMIDLEKNVERPIYK